MKNNTPKLRFKEFTDEWQASHDTKRCCVECGNLKDSKYCNVCRKPTATSFLVGIKDNIEVNDHQKNCLLSSEKVNGKAIKEVIQYCGNKDRNIISEIEKNRSAGMHTKVTHRLFRYIRGKFINVHEHNK